MNIKTLAILLAEDASAEAPEAPTEFVLPENLTEVEDATLAELEAQAISAFDAIRSNPLDADAVQALSDLAEAIKAVRAEARTRYDRAEELTAEAERIAGEIAPVVEDETPEVAPVEGEEIAPVVPIVAGETPEVPAVATEEAPVAVAASATPPAPRRPIRVPLGAIAAQAPEVELPSMPLAITAASDIAGVVSGSRFTNLLDVATAMHSRARHLGNKGRAPVATIQRPSEHTVTERMTFEEQEAVLTAAADPAVLVAAGGWCAPSQFFYDLFSIESVDGLLDVPTVTIERGGLQFVENGGPSIADVLGTGNTVPWLWTEQNDIDAGTVGDPDPTKPCIRIPCVEFVEERLEAHGVCITHGNLADRAYPELTRRYIDLVMAAHEHMMNYRKIAGIVADSTAVTMGASAYGAAPNLLDATELQVLDYRDKYRMAFNTPLEAVFPNWLRGVFRSDMAKTLDGDAGDSFGITDEQINAWFAARGIRPQWVYDYQSLQTGGAGMTAGTPDGVREAYPTTVQFLLYAAGTWAYGNGGVINLGVVRDSTLNATNDHTAAWTEEFHLLAKRGHESRKVTVPIEPSGARHGGLTDTESGTVTY